MEPILRMLGKPGRHFITEMRGQVVHHDMNFMALVRRDGDVHELEELLAAATRITLADHLAGSHVQRREQIRRAVPHVVVSPLLRLAEGDRQQRLRPIG